MKPKGPEPEVWMLLTTVHTGHLMFRRAKTTACGARPGPGWRTNAEIYPSLLCKRCAARYRKYLAAKESKGAD